jgi:tRNA dimethylallyltransferase
VVTGRVLAIVGPTASGKSALALAVAEAHGGEIVNADALQVYRGLDIGTAKPSVEERERIPHHLIDILDPAEVYSAGEFARRARIAIDEIVERGRMAVVVGGSGLYLRALWSGIAPLPESVPRRRAELEAELAARGLEALADELARVDPSTSARIGRRDAQRILRALEVHRSSGVALSEWIRRSPFGSARLPMRKLGLTLPRAVLYDRIESRARAMLARGWAEEIRGLLVSGVPADAPAFQAIGYAELVAAIEGRIGIESAVARLITRTRRFAKRQETWFRREPEIEWLDARRLETQLSECAIAAGTAGGGGKNE